MIFHTYILHALILEAAVKGKLAGRSAIKTSITRMKFNKTGSKKGRACLSWELVLFPAAPVFFFLNLFFGL